MFKLDLEKAEEPEIKLPTSIGSSKKQESSRKTSTSALLTTPKPLIVWITANCGKFFKWWEYQTTLPASWEICMQVQLELDMEQQTGSELGKEYIKEYSLEGLMLKLKLLYFSHLMRRSDSLEKTPMLGKIEGRRRRGWQRMIWLDGITAQWTWVWVSSRGWWWTGSPRDRKDSDMTEWLNWYWCAQQMYLEPVWSSTVICKGRIIRISCVSYESGCWVLCVHSICWFTEHFSYSLVLDLFYKLILIIILHIDRKLLYLDNLMERIKYSIYMSNAELSTPT